MPTDSHTVNLSLNELTVNLVFYPPGASSGSASTEATGDLRSGLWSTAPTGWVLLNGSTIGSPSSGATLAASSTSALYYLLWNNLSNTDAPVSTGRGASAATDYAANKTLTLPDLREKTLIGARPGTNIAGINAALGTSLGANDITLTEAQLPVVAGHTHLGASHVHTLPLYTGGISASAGGTSFQGVNEAYSQLKDSDSTSASTTSGGGFGSGSSHSIVQKSFCINWAVRL